MDLTQLKKALKPFKLSDSDLKCYVDLYSKLHAKPKKISNWKSLGNPDEKKLISYTSLPVPKKESIEASLAQLAVCKLNGGLGTTMNCRGPKSAIIVREKKTFINILVEQISELNKKYKADVPLYFMNSFNTHDATERIISRVKGTTRILSFCQHSYPRLLADESGFLDLQKKSADAWYPPGHGDLFSCILENGYLDSLIKEGRECLFISNADNLGAVIDLKILDYMINEDIPFLMEVTSKTTADMKGGVLCQGKDRIQLLEIANVPPEHVAEFCGNKKFKFFNTNNIWINLIHLKRMLKEGPLDLDLVINRKQVKKQDILQLETTVGSALNLFPGSVGMNVPRSRFLPVKKTSDLLLVQSNLFDLDRGILKRDSAINDSNLPRINLKDPFNDLKEYQRRVPVPPDIAELSSLELEGQVQFNGNVTLKGNVRLISHKKKIRIPKGAVLENKIVES
ncbi:MAG: UTP--glucose-1-phosphate uridylyltransferase [Flavobacteriaceae bacterium]|jgi:UTP--glucose-1-phosphate uridylyltransferase|nr:UTP--glucose-1-phosphate uridylyltransferase [Nitrospina sp.]MBT4709696.1 UTP--glucose-1-phosphate uridylyltransferase [Flavobacteriaceae bacterium]